MTPKEIKEEIYKRRDKGISQTSIAKRIGVSRYAVILVIERKIKKSPRIQAAIAEAIEQPVSLVFSEESSNKLHIE